MQWQQAIVVMVNGGYPCPQVIEITQVILPQTKNHLHPGFTVIERDLLVFERCHLFTHLERNPVFNQVCEFCQQIRQALIIAPQREDLLKLIEYKHRGQEVIASVPQGFTMEIFP